MFPIAYHRYAESLISETDSSSTETSTNKRSRGDLTLKYFEKRATESIGRNSKTGRCVAKPKGGKPRGHYSLGSSNTTLWSHAETCFRLGSNGKLPSGQPLVTGRVLSKKTQDERLIKWIADDQQSLSVVENRSFKSFVKGINPNYTIPTKKTITRQIVNTYATHSDVLKIH
ncbi:hypothetical protein V1522DRAFT_425714 [Lipomyces starkeyi]